MMNITPRSYFKRTDFEYGLCLAIITVFFFVFFCSSSWRILKYLKKGHTCFLSNLPHPHI